MTSESNPPWAELFERNPDEAWQTFLADYHSLVMAVIRKIVHEHDDVMTLYADALERIKEDDCKKLTSYFSVQRSYEFETWIAVVVRNCCLDWLRKDGGRERLSECIKALPAMEQRMYRYIYQQGCSYDTTYELLKSRHDFLESFEEMCSRVDHVHQAVRKSGRWKIIENERRLHSPISLDSSDIDKQVYADLHDISQHDLSPEEKAIHSDSKHVLKEALDSLSAQQQLIIQLHFYRGLTLQEIARVLRMKNLWQVRRKLRKALKKLHHKLKEQGIGPTDLEIF